MVDGTKKTYVKGDSSSPASVVSDTVSKIVSSKRPKTRYRIGKMTKPLVWMRLYLGDRLFNKIITSAS